MKAFFALFIILVSAAPVCSIAQQKPPPPKDYDIKWKTSEFVVRLWTGLGTIIGEEEPWFMVYDHGSGVASPSTKSAEEVVDVFLRQPPQVQNMGLQMISPFYLISGFDKGRLTSFQLKLYNNPAYRKAESDLVDNMKAVCDGLGIALFINTSSDLHKPWRLLTDEKTIKDKKRIRPVK